MSKEKEATTSKEEEATANKEREERAPEKTMVHSGDFITKKQMKKLMNTFESLKSELKEERSECSRRSRKKWCSDGGGISPATPTIEDEDDDESRSDSFIGSSLPQKKKESNAKGKRRRVGADEQDRQNKRRNCKRPSDMVDYDVIQNDSEFNAYSDCLEFGLQKSTVWYLIQEE